MAVSYSSEKIKIILKNKIVFIDELEYIKEKNRPIRITKLYSTKFSFYKTLNLN